MRLSDEDIQEFIEAWQADFGETLSAESGRSEALRLLDFFAWMVEELGFQERERDAPAQNDEPPR
jgi:hypothetical protein